MSNMFETRLKIYPSGDSEYVEFKKGLFYANSAKSIHRSSKTIDPRFNENLPPTENTNGTDSRQDFAQHLLDTPELHAQRYNLSQLQTLSRRKSKVRDYVLSGNFNFFGTLTFRPEEATETLDQDLRKKMILFTRMLRRRKVSYYIVAETHKSGRIHLHGLFSDNLPTETSPASKRYLTIPTWNHGFSSVSQIRDQVGTAHYVTKYVTKEAIPGRSVWVSNGLKRPKVLYNSPDLLTPIISEWYNDNVTVTLRGN